MDSRYVLKLSFKKEKKKEGCDKYCETSVGGGKKLFLESLSPFLLQLLAGTARMLKYEICH